MGLYRGAANSVFYDDGYVGPHNLNPPSSGTVGGYVNNNSQISSHPGSGLPGGGNLRILSFRSDEYRYRSSSSQSSASSSDSKQGVGSYMQWDYHLPTIDSVIVNLITGWSYISTEQSSGEQNVASLSVREQQTTLARQRHSGQNRSLQRYQRAPLFLEADAFMPESTVRNAGSIPCTPPQASPKWTLICPPEKTASVSASFFKKSPASPSD